MDYSRSSYLNVSPYFCHGKVSLEELGQSWLCTSVELEALKMQAEEDIRRRDEELSHLKELLYKAFKERDEAVLKCQKLHIETQLLLQQQQVIHNTQMQQQQQQQVKDEPLKDPDSNTNNNLSSSDCDESIVSSPMTSKLQAFQEEVMEQLLMPDNNRPLPEKGKLLQAVMNAGPLLQTLLLAGPLPQWRHPPPPLESFDIPPVTISINCSNRISRKRGLSTSTDCSDSSTESHKVQNFGFFTPNLD